MQKKIQLPKEQAVDTDELIDGTDVEGHRIPRGATADDLMRRMPSSGGELSPSFPSTGGDLTDEDDVEGHKRH